MKFKIAGIFISIVIILMFGAGVLFFASDSRQSVEKTTTEEKPEGGSHALNTDKSKIEEILKGFAETIFSYDTTKRLYFEGADIYMTKAGYEKFKPLVTDDGEENTPKPFSVISKLQGAQFYYGSFKKNRVEVVMEADISFSATESSSIREYLKLTVEKHNDEWLISDCNVFATIQE